MGIADDIKNSFKQGSIITKLIYINLGVFVVIRLLEVVLKLFKVEGFDFLSFLAMPASTSVFLTCPWTILTYMFLHYGFLHIIFNILFLYWFGRFFLMYYNEKQLVAMYLIGGIFGGVFFMLSYNIFPYFEELKYHSRLLGASASILAVVVGIAVTAPNFEIPLAFIGKVKLKYLALIVVVVDLLSVTSFNSGGHIAHLGGAFSGYLFAVLMKNGKDMTAWLNKTIDFFVNLFKKKPPKMKVTHTQRGGNIDHEYNKNRKQESEQIDAILDKIKKSGYDNLTIEEKKRLFDQSQKIGF